MRGLKVCIACRTSYPRMLARTRLLNLSPASSFVYSGVEDDGGISVEMESENVNWAGTPEVDDLG